MVPKSIRSVLKKYKAALIEEGFPKFDMYLFGSYARGDERTDSDIDLCLVSDAFKSKKREYEKKAVFIAYHIDPRIQVVVTDPYKFKKDPLSPLFSRVRKECIAA
ncbi:MAG: nucleotidyltransferase domain-containing protein [Pseudomonadota bacterium]